MVKVEWSIGHELSPLVAAMELSTIGRLADARLQQSISPVTRRIQERLEIAELDVRQFWSSLPQIGPDAIPDMERSHQALLRAGCSELTADPLAHAIARQLAELRAAVTEVYPRLGDQLVLRGKPLRDQWDAYGAGLVRQLGLLSHRDLLPKRVNLWLVHPAAGGGADVVAAERWGWVEAVLTNVIPEIPEVIRLAWMISAMGLGHPQANRLVAPERLPFVANLASVAVALQAGVELDLLSSAEGLMDVAVAAWRLESPPGVLQRWWEEQRSGAVPFAVSLKALERMLESMQESP